ncbi:hypothetical protein DPMN_112607 [Dreissena polymorpha]|uniref:Uncharacterized protein n=1 Tax=Dreissena polymorpha TaxID=45954 RepID=A0A9D4KFZ3_DREPO|nr:hypothetical protein DPMN_112607 [Dreissena polymorpha]
MVMMATLRTMIHTCLGRRCSRNDTYLSRTRKVIPQTMINIYDGDIREEGDAPEDNIYLRGYIPKTTRKGKPMTLAYTYDCEEGDAQDDDTYPEMGRNATH